MELLWAVVGSTESPPTKYESERQVREAVRGRKEEGGLKLESVWIAF